MFDPEQVKLLTGLSDDQVRVLTQTFLTEVRDSSNKLDVFFAAADWAAIRKLAHRIKPSYYLMGVAEVVPLIDYFLAIDVVHTDVVLLGLNVMRFQKLGMLLEQELEASLHHGMLLA